MLNVRPVRNIPTFLASVVLTACSVYTPSLLDGPVTNDDDEVRTDDDTSDDPEMPSSTGTPTSTNTSNPPGTGSGTSTSTTSVPPATSLPPGATTSAPTTAPTVTDKPMPSMMPTGTTPGTGATTPTTTPTDSTAMPSMTETAPTAPGTVEPEPTEETPEEEVPSDDPLVDDFEDSSEQVRIEGSREGFWFARGNASDDGTITDIEDAFVELAGGENTVALHVVAQGFVATDTWAVFGTNFNAKDPAPAYIQAAQYTGLRFWACGGLGASKVALEVATTDTSSAYDHEDNHYRFDVSLTATWKMVEVPWDDMKQTWGDTTDFDPEHVLGLQFNITTGEEGFDVWLDDLEFIDPAGTTVTAPRTGGCPQSTPPPDPEPTDAG